MSPLGQFIENFQKSLIEWEDENQQEIDSETMGGNVVKLAAAKAERAAINRVYAMIEKAKEAI